MTPAAFVLDSSAVLALLHEEPGAGFVESHLPESAMSCVNLSEVIQKADQHGVWEPGIEADLEALGVRIHPFTATDARMAAAVWSAAPTSGLSLGDRACLALAARLGLPAITTDRAWLKAEIQIEVVDARSQ